MKNKIFVTKPLFPRLENYEKHLEDIWSSGWLSNNGEKHQLLEESLKSFLGAPNISLFNNGTIALLTAIQSLRLQGEVITTPFTFPATTHVLPWNNIEPVFCDIDPDRLTIDPNKIESLITAKTTAILGVHVYGVPCHVNEIQEIADSHGLKVIYDAAHAFSTVLDGKPIGSYGDISMLSFHPTKLFHTGEGGALIYNDSNLKKRIEYLKNFGIKNEEEVLLPGINGKMNELQAAMGLEVLPLVRKEQELRREIRSTYRKLLSNIDRVGLLEMPNGSTNSEQYLCVRICSDKYPDGRNQAYNNLKEAGINARKYFYPLVSDYPCYSSLPSASRKNLPVANKVCDEVLCLPLYSSLAHDDVFLAARLIKEAINA